MPAYNAAAFVREALDSILAQTFRDFELIILNDGSTDDTQAIVEGYPDERIRLINKSNSGVASTLNLGLTEAQGEFIWRHDADDISLPEKLARQVAFLDNHPEFVLCATQIAFMTERGKIAWDKRQPKTNWLGDADFREVRFEDFAPFSPVTHGTTLFRRSILKVIPSYREAFITSEDIDMWLRMMEHGKLAVLNQCLSLHRLSSASATAVHGWKNEFYRELAKEFWKQRRANGSDELELNGSITEPEPPAENKSNSPKPGRIYRSDLLNFPLSVHINARDWLGVSRIIRHAIRQGWQLPEVYRIILIQLLPGVFVKSIVKLKSWLRHPSSAA